MTTDYVEDYETLTGKQRDADTTTDTGEHHEVDTKVITPPAAVKVAKPTAAQVE